MGVYAGSEQVENVACMMNFLGDYQTCKTGIDKHCSRLKRTTILSIPALEGRLLLSWVCFLIVSVRNGYFYIFRLVIDAFYKWHQAQDNHHACSRKGKGHGRSLRGGCCFTKSRFSTRNGSTG